MNIPKQRELEKMRKSGRILTKTEKRWLEIYGEDEDFKGRNAPTKEQRVENLNFYSLRSVMLEQYFQKHPKDEELAEKLEKKKQKLKGKKIQSFKESKKNMRNSRSGWLENPDVEQKENLKEGRWRNFFAQLALSEARGGTSWRQIVAPVGNEQCSKRSQRTTRRKSQFNPEKHPKT